MCIRDRFKVTRVAVIGGGNSGVEAAIGLAGVGAHVTLLEFDPTLRADAILQKKLFSLNNVKVITSALTTEVTGDGKKVSGLVSVSYTHLDVYKRQDLTLPARSTSCAVKSNSSALGSHTTAVGLPPLTAGVASLIMLRVLMSATWRKTDINSGTLQNLANLVCNL